MRVAKALPSMVFALVAVAVAAPGASAAVVLNEVDCDADWIELVNTGATAADVSGWLLTDDPIDAAPPRADHRFTLPAGSIPASGSVTFDKGAGGFPFGIKCGEDTIRLADSAGSPVDDVAVPALAVSTDTWGRFPNGTGDWTETTGTKGSPNQPSSGGGGPADAAAWLFDPHAVVQIDLQLPQATIDALAVEPEEYHDATFSLQTTGGVYGPYAVGVRLKGGLGSFRTLSGKAAFKLKFNHSVPSQRFFGLKKLTLNNMVQDPSMVHEVLAYRAFNAMDVPAPRTGYAFVRVNGDAYGVYLNVESLDDVALPRMFPSTAHLYEGAYGTDVEPGGAAAFEVDEGSESDRSDLEALIAAANGSGGDWSDRVGEVADLQEMTRMWAVEKYVGHEDGYSGYEGTHWPNNFYLHSDATGRFSMMPWGTDQAWLPRIKFDDKGGLLFKGCLTDASCRQMYRLSVAEAREAITALNLEAEVQALGSMLAPWQALDPRHESTPAGIQAGLNVVRDFLAVRPGDAAAWLGLGQPTGPAPKPLLLPRGTAATAGPAAAQVVRARRSARVLTVRVRLPRAGRVRLRSSARMGGATRTVCTAKGARQAAGDIRLRCHLRKTAKRLLRSRSLRLKLRTRFVPAEGRPVTTIRKLTVPRCRRASRC